MGIRLVCLLNYLRQYFELFNQGPTAGLLMGIIRTDWPQFVYMVLELSYHLLLFCENILLFVKSLN